MPFKSSPQEGKHLLRPGTPEPIDLDDKLGEVALSVDLSADVPGPLDGILTVVVRAGGEKGEKSVRLHVPRPDAVRLLAFDADGREVGPAVDAAGGSSPGAADPGGNPSDRPADVETIVLRPARPTRPSTDYPSADQTPIQLRPFPNRETAFQLKVKNESESDKTLSIELVAPRNPESDVDWYRNVVDEGRKLTDRMISLRDPVSLKVPAGATAAVPFEGAAGADKPADKPAKAAASAPDKTVTKGLAVLVRDKDDEKKCWVQRIEFKPYKPSDYLERDESKTFYDPAGHVLHVGLKARDDVPYPRDTAIHPVTVAFETEPHIATLKDKEIKSPSRTAEFDLFIEHGPPDKNLRMFFKVNECPHALQYVCPDLSDQPNRVEPDDTVAAQIITPKDKQVFDLRNPFDAHLTFEVHAPTDFLDQPDDKIEIKALAETGQVVWPANEDRVKVLHGRQCDVKLCGAGSEGELRVATTTGKFDVSLAELPVKKQKLRIQVAPYHKSTHWEGRRHDASVAIVFDEPPEVQVPVLSEVQIGPPLSVEFTVKSLSEVKSVECGFEDPDPSKRNQFAQEPKAGACEPGGGGRLVGEHFDRKTTHPRQTRAALPGHECR